MTYMSYLVRHPFMNGRTEPGMGEEFLESTLHSRKLKALRKHTLYICFLSMAVAKGVATFTDDK